MSILGFDQSGQLFLIQAHAWYAIDDSTGGRDCSMSPGCVAQMKGKFQVLWVWQALLDSALGSFWGLLKGSHVSIYC